MFTVDIKIRELYNWKRQFRNYEAAVNLVERVTKAATRKKWKYHIAVY